MYMQPDNLSARDVAVRMLALAFAKSIPVGAGLLHFKASDTIDDKDVIITLEKREKNGSGFISADHTNGRMMEFYVAYDADGVTMDNRQLTRNCQSWAIAYPTYLDLYLTATEQLLAERKGKANDPT